MADPASAAPAPTLWLRLFLPFAAGYLLSYLFRTSNAVVGPVLAAELALPDHALGLLTSTYFVTFAAAQIRSACCSTASARAGSKPCCCSPPPGRRCSRRRMGLAGLAWGRALIGVGVSACLMAALTAFNRSFPPERQASLIGWVMSPGGLPSGSPAGAA